MDETDFLLPKQSFSSTNQKDIDMDQNMLFAWLNLSFKIGWEHTSQEIRQNHKESKKYIKQILFEQSGYVTSNEVLYIMGASGSGKTTLLNCLSGKAASKGQVSLNKTLKINKDNFSKFGAFVTK